MAKGVKTGGRKKGIPNKTTLEKAATIAASGLTPLDYMLSVLRDERQDTPARMDAAKAAAPYVHCRMPQQVDLGGALEVTVSTKEQRDAAVAAAMRADQ